MTKTEVLLAVGKLGDIIRGLGMGMGKCTEEARMRFRWVRGVKTRIAGLSVEAAVERKWALEDCGLCRCGLRLPVDLQWEPGASVV